MSKGKTAITFCCGECGELFTEHGSNWQIAWRFLFGPASTHLCGGTGLTSERPGA